MSCLSLILPNGSDRLTESRSLFWTFYRDCVPNLYQSIGRMVWKCLFSLAFLALINKFPALGLNEVYPFPPIAICRIFTGFLRPCQFIPVYPFPICAFEFVPTFGQNKRACAVFCSGSQALLLSRSLFSFPVRS